MKQSGREFYVRRGCIPKQRKPLQAISRKITTFSTCLLSLEYCSLINRLQLRIEEGEKKSNVSFKER